MDTPSLVTALDRTRRTRVLVEELINDPGLSLKMKRGNKAKIEEALSEAMQQLEIEDSSSDDLKKKELALKRAMTKAMATR